MKDNKGSVLLYSLFLMLALSATAMMTSFVILVNTRSTANSTKSISAYYAAETGIEQSLYIIKDSRFSKMDVSDAITAATISSTELSNDALYSTSANNAYKTSLTFNLESLASAQIDFSDPDTGAALISSPGTIYLSWEKDPTCVDGSLELNIRSYASATWDDESADSSDVWVLPCAVTCEDNTKSLSASLGHKIKLKPLYCDLNNITLSVKVGDESVAFPNYIKIESTGNMGRTTYPLQAETIWKPPLSGLGDYVIFSEAPISK